MTIRNHSEIYSAAQLMAFIQEVGFLPLLDSGIQGFDAESIVADDCRYVTFPDGGWEWALWKWKGPIVQDMPCMYGKFFNRKAGFISQDWWPDFCNYRRSKYPAPSEGSIEETILLTLETQGSLITRDLRTACGFTGKGMRSKFDAYLTRLEMACRLVTEDFIYPQDRHGREYGWGWSLLSTPEKLYGEQHCSSEHSAEESFSRLLAHFRKILPEATDKQLLRLIG
ncbi:MAG: hypothetical protein GXY64_04715 [Bacteroidales bacterium]|nr:hypothetical protein [Bacteroidales bacterium]